MIRQQRDELLDTLRECEAQLSPDLRALHADRLAFLAGLVRANADDAVHLLHGHRSTLLDRDEDEDGGTEDRSMPP
ncbi:hypothetical protein [Deinococcus pimensis]|uniref:hypothetical protein n=1 Tax=Deinococcus pimensis TaxID=309888 RepID=UPI00048673E4|nr:hypothetical protein [Deinococcus pimensis]